MSDVQLSALEYEALKRDAEMWRSLMSYVNQTPCYFPCLRDDLADWLRVAGASARSPDNTGDSAGESR